MRRIEQNKELYKFLQDFWRDEVGEFIEWAYTPPPCYIRVNTLKIDKEALIKRLTESGFELEEMDFYDDALKVTKSPQEIGRTLEHYMGYYYVQDAASMLPPLVLEPEPGELILDIAAAPGSKTTQIAQMMRNKGVIIANDNSIKRIKALTSNIDRLGILNVVVTEMDGHKIALHVEDMCDRVLVDPPCSAIGTLAKSNEIVGWWTTGRTGSLVRTQRGLILAAFRALKPGGVLVYSTCTIVPEENEGIIDFLLKREERADVVEFEIPGVEMMPGITEWKRNRYDERVAKTRKVVPHKNQMEGFYIAKIVKLE